MRTRDLLGITLLTLVVVSTTAGVGIVRLARVGVEQVQARSESEVLQLVAVAQVAIQRAPEMPPEAAIADDPAVAALLGALIAHEPECVYALIEGEDGTPLASGTTTGPSSPPPAPPLSELVEAGSLERLRRLLHGGDRLELAQPLELGGRAFGRVRFGIDTSLLRARLFAGVARGASLLAIALALSWVVALSAARLTRRPIRALSQQIERLLRGDPIVEDAAWNFELAELAAQLRLLGDELRSARLGRLAEMRTLREILDHLEDGVLLVDGDDVVVFYNRALASVMGRPLADAADLALDEILPVSHPFVAATRHVRLDGAALEHVAVSIEDVARFQEAMLSVFPFQRRDEPPGLVLLVEDLGGFRTLQELVTYSAKVTEIGRMTAGVAHEVRNPLHAMKLHLEVIRTSGLSDETGRRAIGAMERSLEDLTRLVQGVLDYLRPIQLELAEFDLEHLLSGLATFLEPEARSRRVQIVLEPPETKTMIQADESQLRQAFLNLMQNAFEAMPEGGTLRLGVLREDGHVRVRVTDSGRGIAPEDRERIFQLYYTTRRGGSGIGLSVVHRIVMEHRGSIDVESAPGCGTTFTVRLPLRQAGRGGEGEERTV